MIGMQWKQVCGSSGLSEAQSFQHGLRRQRFDDVYRLHRELGPT